MIQMIAMYSPTGKFKNQAVRHTLGVTAGWGKRQRGQVRLRRYFRRSCLPPLFPWLREKRSPRWQFQPLRVLFQYKGLHFFLLPALAYPSP